MRSSVGQQMPELYLRGSLCNVTMRNLTKEEREYIGTIVEQIKEDPLLQKCRAQFKSALSNTISGDYRSNKDFAAEQEYIVAIWKTTVAAVKGWGKHPPCPQTLVNPIERKKFFQTWVFNYLRQILNENKRAIVKTTTLQDVETIDAFKHHVCGLFGKNAKVTILTSGGFRASSDLYSISAESIKKLHDLISTYLSKKLEIALDDSGITVHRGLSDGNESIDAKINSRIRITSTYSDDSDKPSLEIADMSTGINDPDAMSAYYDSLSDKAKKVMDVITNTPDAYIDRYKTIKPIQKYIAEYLDIKPKEIKAIYEEMRIKYAQTIGKPAIE